MTNALTELLLAHRKAQTTLSDLPAELVPADMAAAYAIQNETLKVLGPVGAWKVSPVPQSGEPFCSPLPASLVYPDGAQLRRADLAGLAVEVEVAVILQHDLTSTAKSDEIIAAIGSVHLALEIVASRYADRKAVPQTAAFADLQSNGAIVMGPATQFSTLPEFGAQAITLFLDSKEAGSTATGASTENILAALQWLASHAASRGMPLTAGTVVITGARLGPTPFGGQTARAEAPGLGQVSASFD